MLYNESGEKIKKYISFLYIKYKEYNSCTVYRGIKIRITATQRRQQKVLNNQNKLHKFWPTKRTTTTTTTKITCTTNNLFFWMHDTNKKQDSVTLVYK